MARPVKKGIDYFPFDTKFFKDRKIRILYSHFQSDGIIVYLYLLCEIYENEGYYLKIDDDYIDLMSCDLNMSSEKIGQIINFLCKRSLFDNTLFTSDKVVTAHGIQARFQEAVKNRGKKNYISVLEKFWVLREDETQGFVKLTHFEDYSGKNPDYSEKNYDYSTEKPPKEKERKEKESKVNKSKEEERKSVTSAAADKIIRRYENLIGLATPSVAEGIDYYISQGMEEALMVRIIEYACEQNKRSWQYINAVLLGNLKEEVRTLAEYNRKQAERTEQNRTKLNSETQRAGAVKKSRFNNYTDTNKGKHSNIQEEILKEMMEE